MVLFAVTGRKKIDEQSYFSSSSEDDQLVTYLREYTNSGKVKQSRLLKQLSMKQEARSDRLLLDASAS